MKIKIDQSIKNTLHFLLLAGVVVFFLLLVLITLNLI
jgi:hypothetical protein